MARVLLRRKPVAALMREGLAGPGALVARLLEAGQPVLRVH